MYIKSILRTILLGLLVVFVASCDKDYDQLGTDIVGNDHFGFSHYTGATIKSYNMGLGPVASNNLPINPLGFYENPAFGNGHADFVTQLEMTTVNQTFNNGPVASDHPNGPTVLDSVVLSIPYYSRLQTTNTDGTKLYTLDSIYGEQVGTSLSKFKLSVYQSNYYLRDLDPNQSLGQSQLFYTDQGNDIDGYKVGSPLNDLPTSDAANADGHENSQFFFDAKEHKTTVLNTTDNTTTTTRSVPAMRLHLSKTAFTQLILNAPSGQLATNETFKNYFRGLYFKTESIGNPGNMAMLNFKGGTVTLYYNEDVVTPDDVTTTLDEYKVVRTNKTLPFNLTGNTVSLLNNSNENGSYLAALSNPSQEASQLFLKGGQGSVAVIDLFGNTDLKGYTRNTNYDSTLPISDTNPRFLLNPGYNPNLPISNSNSKYLLTGPNGVPDEIDDIKVNNWLINEANLTFKINTGALSNTKTIEPGRIFLYDLNNKKPIVDYSYDFSSNSVYPKYSKTILGGILLDADGNIVKQIKDATTGVITNKGNQYKIRITNHIRNLIEKDSTNVRLGLSVTETINNVGFSKLKTATTTTNSAPTMSVQSQLGTILYGTNLPLTDDNRLKLEIYYTKPN